MIIHDLIHRCENSYRTLYGDAAGIAANGSASLGSLDIPRGQMGYIHSAHHWADQPTIVIDYLVGGAQVFINGVRLVPQNYDGAAYNCWNDRLYGQWIDQDRTLEVVARNQAGGDAADVQSTVVVFIYNIADLIEAVSAGCPPWLKNPPQWLLDAYRNAPR